jgi:hypothetical protein
MLRVLGSIALLVPKPSLGSRVTCIRGQFVLSNPSVHVLDAYIYIT